MDPQRPPLSGGCACEALRYEVTAAPSDPAFCHCHTCQGVSGAPVLAYASAPAEAFRWTRGEPRCYRSSPEAIRTFCATCGAQLTMQLDARPDVIDFTIATLDDPDPIAPAFHIWDRSRIAWLRLADPAPRFPRGRPAAPDER